MGAKTLQGKDLQNTPICPAWKLAPTSAEKARQSQLGIHGKWGEAGAGARSCNIFHVCQYRSCRPICSFHLDLLLTRQQNVLKGEIRKIVFIPSILRLGWLLLCCKIIALCHLSSLCSGSTKTSKEAPTRPFMGQKKSDSSLMRNPPRALALRIEGRSFGEKKRPGLFGCNAAAIGDTWGLMEQAGIQLTPLRKQSCLSHLRLFWFFAEPLCEKP